MLFLLFKGAECVAKEFSRTFYKSKAWKETREYIFIRDKGLCQDCLERGTVTPGKEVHHIKHLEPSNMDIPSITLGADNLRLLCKECHSNRHRRKDTTREGLVFNERGELIENERYI